MEELDQYFKNIRLNNGELVPRSFEIRQYVFKSDLIKVKLKIGSIYYDFLLDMIPSKLFLAFGYPIIERISFGLDYSGYSLNKTIEIFNMLLAEEEMIFLLKSKAIYLPIFFDERKYRKKEVELIEIINNVEGQLNFKFNEIDLKDYEDLILGSSLFVKRMCKLGGKNNKFVFFINMD